MTNKTLEHRLVLLETKYQALAEDHMHLHRRVNSLTGELSLRTVGTGHTPASHRNLDDLRITLTNQLKELAKALGWEYEAPLVTHGKWVKRKRDWFLPY